MTLSSTPSTPIRGTHGASSLRGAPSTPVRGIHGVSSLHGVSAIRSACFWFFMGVVCTILTIREYSVATFDFNQWSVAQLNSVFEEARDLERNPTLSSALVDLDVDNNIQSKESSVILESALNNVN